jgi:hypothetical protein
MADGILSWSHALAAIKKGKKARFTRWRDDKYVHVVFPTEPGRLSYIEIVTAHGSAPYNPTRCETFDDLWEILDD